MVDKNQSLFFRRTGSAFLICLFAVTILVVLLLAFEYAWGKENKPVKKRQAEYDKKPFNLTVDKLPINYYGHDIEKVYQELSNKFFQKDEFETKEEYVGRTTPRIADYLYAFKFDSDIFCKRTTYDVENQTLKVTIDGSSTSIWGQKSEPGNPDFEDVIIFKSVKVGEQSYTGTNAFGVKKLIHKITYKNYGIALVNRYEFGKKSIGRRQEEIVINILPSEAKKLKDNLSVLLICKIKAPENRFLYAFEDVSGRPLLMCHLIKVHFCRAF